ncbi:TIGR01906 family membrane protein [Candidatus Mycoplasma pogonae]
MKKFISFLLNVILSSLIIYTLLGIVIVGFFYSRWFYYWQVDYLDIPATSGFKRPEIIQNYNILIDYLDYFKNGDLTQSTFKISETAKIHFEEVKNIMSIIGITTIISLILVLFLTIICFIFKIKYYWIWNISYFGFILVVIGIIVFADFGNLFEKLHKIFFGNNYWIFDPNTDDYIKILPWKFFRNSLLFILAFWLTGQFLVTIIGWKINRIRFKKLQHKKQQKMIIS